MLNALNEFVANGGNMVVTFKSAFSDEHLKIRHDVQPYIINKSLGIQYDEFTLPDDVTVTCGGKSSKARDWMEMVDCTTATPVAMYEHQIHFFARRRKALGLLSACPHQKVWHQYAWRRNHLSA